LILQMVLNSQLVSHHNAMQCRSGVEPHYTHSWDERDWQSGRGTSGGSAWGGSVIGRFESRLGFSELASSDMPLTKENGAESSLLVSFGFPMRVLSRACLGNCSFSEGDLRAAVFLFCRGSSADVTLIRHFN
jgi:hypothetical protein